MNIRDLWIDLMILPQIYELMLQCWRLEPSLRPGAGKLADQLSAAAEDCLNGACMVINMINQI